MKSSRVLMAAVIIMALLMGLGLGCGKKKAEVGVEGEGTVEQPRGAAREGPPGRAERPGPPGRGRGGPGMPGGRGEGGPPMVMGADAAALVSEGIVAKRAGQYDDAELKFREAIVTDPNNEDAHWGLAWVLAEKGQKQEAISEFEKVLELTGDPAREKEAQSALRRLQ